MSKKKKQYDAQALYVDGLLAFGNLFAGVQWTKSALTKRQQRSRLAFKAARIARRKQRQAKA